MSYRKLFLKEITLDCLTLNYVGDWLNVVPLSALGLQFQPKEFRFSVLYTLGVPVVVREAACVKVQVKGLVTTAFGATSQGQNCQA